MGFIIVVQNVSANFENIIFEHSRIRQPEATDNINLGLRGLKKISID
jgi:hypothetical protein